MKKWLWLAALLGLFVGHARWMLSEKSVHRWIELHEQAAFDQKEGVCNDFTYDVAVSIRAGNPKQQWQVDGGRDYVCDYIKVSNASVRLLKPEIRTEIEMLRFQPAGFPWMTARAEVRIKSVFTLAGGRTLTEEGESTYVVRRGLRSLAISKLEVASEGQFPR